MSAPTESTQADASVDVPPEPISAIDRLLAIYRHRGPFTSAYLAVEPVAERDRDKPLLQRWGWMRDRLELDGAPKAALDAIEARLRLPRPADTGGIAILAAADGATTVGHGDEPPMYDHGVVDALPYAAPLLEWQQRQVPHLVVTVSGDGDGAGADITVFGAEHYTDNRTVTGGYGAYVDAIATDVERIRAELVVLSGAEADTAPVADLLATRLPIRCRVAIEPQHETLGELADAAVRLVSDAAARKTVASLREHRFLDAHEEAVDGRAATVAALSDGTAVRVLLHDDPNDDDRLWFGDEPTELSTTERPGLTQGRLIDAMIRSAVLQGIEVHVIPSTGSTGPDDNMAAMLTHDAQADDSQSNDGRADNGR